MKNAQKKYALVLDVGTSSVKALLFDEHEKIISQSSKCFAFSRPHKGWVEQDPLQYVTYSIKVIKDVLRKSRIPTNSISGIGIANQRETVIAWEKNTGKPLYPAIVWQDARSSVLCKKLAKKYLSTIRFKTGLDLIPYFSASKIHWLLNECSAVKKAYLAKTLCVGTIDTWLMWNLLKGNPYCTDITNASRTLLYNIRTKKWDNQLCDLFAIPSQLLANVVSSQNNFGMTKKDLLGLTIPLTAVSGDQQASMVAAGIKKGATKITYGTGTFVMQIIGKEYVFKKPFFTTLVSWGNKTQYVLEGKIQYGGKEIEKYLLNEKLLNIHLKNLAKRVDTLLKKLPIKPRLLTIDGGVMRDGLMTKIQSNVSRTPISSQKVYNGTALGVAKMIFQKR